MICEASSKRFGKNFLVGGLELFQDLRKGSVARQWWRMMEPLLMEK